MTTLQTVMARNGICRLTRENDSYVMAGPTGSHNLAVSCTNEARLDAHWEGFISNNGGRLTAVTVRTNRIWNGQSVLFNARVLGVGHVPGTLVVHGRIWKSRPKDRRTMVVRAPARSEGIHPEYLIYERVKTWVPGKEPKWVQALLPV